MRNAPLEEPDWELLPEDPAAFFGSEATRDELALRRAYTRLIKLYKPETQPDRFRLVRDAYERLTGDLRLRGALREAGLDDDGVAVRARSPQVEGTGDEDDRERIDLAQVLRDGGPRGLVSALRAQKTRGPRDWILLALVEEELEGGNAWTFARVLLEGLQETSGAMTLFWAFTSGYRTLTDPEVARRLIRCVAEAAGTGRRGSRTIEANFWGLTETAWKALQDSLDQASFAAELAAFRERFGASPGLPFLLCKVWRSALCSPRDAWITEIRASLQQRLVGAGELGCFEFDTIDWLADRLPLDVQVWSGHPLRGHARRTIEAIARGDEPKATQEFLEFTVLCLDDPASVLTAFPPHDPRLAAGLEILEWYGALLERRLPERGPVDARRLARCSVELMRHTETSSHRAPTAWVWGAMMLGYFCAMPLLLIAPIGLYHYLDQSGHEVAKFVCAGIGLMLLGLALSRFETRARERLSTPFVRRLHRRSWRGRVAELLHGLHVPLDSLLRTLALRDFDRFGLRNWILRTSQSDLGLRVLGLAQSFAQ